VVRAFIKKGGQVAIFDLNEVAGQAMVRELGTAAIFAKANVSDESSAAAAIAKTMAAFGAIHVCVNCAASAVRTRPSARMVLSRSRSGIRPSRST